ncbi:amidohydrolase family protein [Rufibacter psychrotolerans]|uniref:amidohydrolase family protein n=1 Tax=Rufibacter psychrotolerans TaxID=2812556 RepID=UPI001967F0B8|nr:amidohydrolase family protein [Rufibacter sp. SYSU D00308]
MGRIDAHQHFWRYRPDRDTWITEEMAVLRQDFLPQDLQPLLAAAGLEGCVAVQASSDDTAFLLENARRHPFIKGVVGWVDFLAENLGEQLEHLRQYGHLKGFRHVLQSEPDRDFMLREPFMRGIGQLQPYGFTYDLLIYQDQLPATLAFVKAFPNQPFVLDHLAKPSIKAQLIRDWARDIRKLAEQEHVCCKVSGMVTEADWQHWTYEDFVPYLEVVVEAFGVNRILYGSDWPVCLLAGSYHRVLGLVERYFAGFSPAEQDAIFGGNATRFYKLT